MDYLVLSSTIWYYLILSGSIWDYLQLSRTRGQVEAGESKLLLFETFPLFFYLLQRRVIEELALLKRLKNIYFSKNGEKFCALNDFILSHKILKILHVAQFWIFLANFLHVLFLNMAESHMPWNVGFNSYPNQ